MYGSYFVGETSDALIPSMSLSLDSPFSFGLYDPQSSDLCSEAAVRQVQ